MRHLLPLQASHPCPHMHSPSVALPRLSLTRQKQSQRQPPSLLSLACLNTASLPSYHGEDSNFTTCNHPGPKLCTAERKQSVLIWCPPNKGCSNKLLFYISQCLRLKSERFPLHRHHHHVHPHRLNSDRGSVKAGRLGKTGKSRSLFAGVNL